MSPAQDSKPLDDIANCQAPKSLDDIATCAAREAAIGEWQKSFTSEVKAIAGKLDGIVKDYKVKHDGLHERWKLQGKEIESLRKSITGIYENWKTLIEVGVCPTRKDIADN